MQPILVHLLRDCGGGATEADIAWAEQRLTIFPGVYLVKNVDAFYAAYEGRITWAVLRAGPSANSQRR